MPSSTAISDPALVLNASYEPLCVVSGRRAAVLVLTAKAVPVAAGEAVLHSERTALAVPVVVRLARFKAFIFEDAGNEVANIVFVVDDEDVECHYL